MTKYREILRLKSLGFSERNIAQSCGVSRNTVAKASISTYIIRTAGVPNWIRLRFFFLSFIFLLSLPEKAGYGFFYRHPSKRGSDFKF